MNGKLKFGSAFAAVLAIGLLLGLLAADLSHVTKVSVNDQFKRIGAVDVVIIRNGVVVYSYSTHNLVVTDGSTWVKEFLRIGTTGATNATDDIAVGNHTTPAASDTILNAECTTANLTRQSCTPTNINATAYQVVYERIASGTVVVNATSLHHDPTGNTSGNAVAIASITQASLISGDTLKVT
jgi:hypothetical protein